MEHETAQPGEHDTHAAAGHVEHHPSVGDLLWPAANFLIFAVVLARFLCGPIKEYFRDRTQRLREGLAAGRRAREEAAALRAALERDRAELPAVKAKLQTELRAAADAQRHRLLEQGREATVRIRHDAELLATQEAAGARHALREEVIGEAMRRATELVRDAIQPDDQKRFVQDFVRSAEAAS